MTKTSTTSRRLFRYLGTTDDVVDCQREGCRKVGLSHTVVIVPLDENGNDDGEPTYYGSDCAAKVLGVRGGGREVLKSASAWMEITFANAVEARRKLALYRLPEVGPIATDTVEFAFAVKLYEEHNRGVRGAFGEELRRRVLDMAASEQRAVADARALKLRGVTN